MSDGVLLLLKKKANILALLVGHNRIRSAKIYELDHDTLVGNIYVGKVKSIATNMDAAFVEIADGVECFLPNEVLGKRPFLLKREFDGKLKPGDELLVQVKRDAVKSKQPVLSAKISLAGNYLVLADDSNKLGISGKLPAAKKEELANFLIEKNLVTSKLICTNNESMVVRTNAGQLTDFAPIAEEWERLTGEIKALKEIAGHRTCFSCLKKNAKPYLEDLKDYYAEEMQEVVTDCPEIYEEVKAHYESLAQTGVLVPNLRLYEDAYPLEKLYSVKTQLEEAYGKRVWLKSGGYLVIEPTEALTVIDVNSGRYESKKNSEDSYMKINMEAAEEIAVQLRLRNLSGIIVVDFINMESEKHKQDLLTCLKRTVKKDYIKTTVVDMTPLGLVEITRKKISRPLYEIWNGNWEQL